MKNLTSLQKMLGGMIGILFLINILFLWRFVSSKKQESSQTHTSLPPAPSKALTDEEIIVAVPTNYVDPRSGAPLPLPTEIQELYPNSQLYKGILSEMEDNSLTIRGKNNVYVFSFINGADKDNTVFGILNAETKRPSRFLIPEEFKATALNKEVEVIANVGSAHAHQVLLTQ